jgi:twitching motility two-component system response regulator PilG
MNEATKKIAPSPGIRIILIDESFAIRHSGETFLSQAGCRVMTAEDCFEGLSKVAYCPPDMVLVDAGMPGMDGYQICALIRKHFPHHDMPVILLIGEGNAFDQTRGKQAGTDLFLIKPFDRERLVEAVATHIRQPSDDKRPAKVKNLLQAS